MQKFIKQNKLLSAIIVIGIIAVLFLYLGPQTPTVTTHSKVATNSTATSVADGDVSDDTSAHFAPYVGSARDPFIPQVTLSGASTLGSGAGGLDGGKWQLTGINSINGETSALIENSATNESVFLNVGDSWNGMKVVAIHDDSVDMINDLGQPTQIGFAAPPPPPGEAGANLGIGFGAGAMSAMNAPGVTQINPLPPMTPDFGTQQTQPFRRGRGQSSN